METIKAIKTRRSVRRFDTRKVSVDTIKDIVNVATYAPSWKNSQTTRYRAIMDTEIKNEIANNGVMGFESNKNIIDSAPTLIVMTTINNRSGYERDGNASTSKGTHWQSFDAGLAAEAFVLACHEYNVRSVIMGIFDEEKIKNILKIDETESVSALIAIGYNDSEFVAPPRKDADTLLTII